MFAIMLNYAQVGWESYYAQIYAGIMCQGLSLTEICFSLMQDDWTALAWAVHCGYADIARFLLEKGATMDFENEEVSKIT